jgi:hypothetical protein
MEGRTLLVDAMPWRLALLWLAQLATHPGKGLRKSVSTLFV